MPISESRSALFQSEFTRSNAILARTLLNEMMRGGWTRTQMLEFVNCFLGLLSGSARSQPARPEALLVDPQTGFPTRAGFHRLLLHELSPQANSVDASLVLVELLGETDLVTEAKLLRHCLRSEDVVAPLGRGMIAALTYCPSAELERTAQRMLERMIRARRHRSDPLPAQGGGVKVRVAAQPVRRPGSPRALWFALFRTLKCQVAFARAPDAL